MTTSIQHQTALAGLINRFYSNTIKGGERNMKPLTYLVTRLSTLEDYWKEFYNHHFQIILDPDCATAPYVLYEKYFESGAH